MQVFSDGYIQFIIYPGKVRLVCLAPLTNIALTMKTYAHFASSLKDIYVMGGNCTGNILLNTQCVVTSYV
jgi:inosine-uridine nucleoside N-ribohydrolase